MAGSVLGASSLAALTPLGGQMQALAVTIAGDVVCSQCVGINGDGTNDIKDASVTNAKLADSAVTTSKIADGTIRYADVSRSLIAVEHRDDCNCGGAGWDPNGTSSIAYIFDNRISNNSVVSVSVPATVVIHGGLVCWTASSMGEALVVCNGNIPDGYGINYAIFNNPAYG